MHNELIILGFIIVSICIIIMFFMLISLHKEGSKKEIIFSTSGLIIFITSLIFLINIYNETKNSIIPSLSSPTILNYDSSKAILPVVEPSHETLIGMEATLLYLLETNQIDSIKLDIHRLFILQDSLNNNR